MANWDSRFEKWFYIIYVICTPKSLLSFIWLSSKIQTKTCWNEFSSMYVCILCVFLKKKKKKSNLMCFSTKLHSKEEKTSLSDTSHISYRKQKSLCLFFHAQWRIVFFLLHTVVCLRSKEEEEIKFMEAIVLFYSTNQHFSILLNFIPSSQFYCPSVSSSYPSISDGIVLRIIKPTALISFSIWLLKKVWL